MKTLTFAKRNLKEIARDPLTLFFGIIFPLILLLLMSAIQANIPVEIFEISRLAPGIVIFGLSFASLFSATLISRDRESEFLNRCYSSPLKSWDYIIGYAIPFFPIVIVQAIICYAVSLVFKLEITLNLLLAIVAIIPSSTLFIALGVVFGSILNTKQVGGICGALLTNLTAWLSGIWFDLSLVGGWFEKIVSFLPFVHAVNLQRNILAGNFSGCLVSFIVVMAYAVALSLLAVWLFLKQMKK
jgi:ABC-2 type transport system permease protein